MEENSEELLLNRIKELEIQCRQLKVELTGRQADLQRSISRAVNIVRACYDSKIADLERQLAEARDRKQG